MPQSIGLRNLRILQSIFDASKESIAALDTNWNIIAFNTAWHIGFQKLSGVSVELGINMKDAIVHIPELYKSFTSLWERALKGEAFIQTVNPPTQLDSFFEITFSPLFNEQNQLMGSSQIVRDITDSIKNQKELQHRKQQLEITINQLQKEITDHAIDQAALLESEFLHKTLNELTQTFTWKFDLRGQFKLVNLSWGQVTGLTVEQSVGLGWMEAIHPDERALLENLWRNNEESCQSTFRIWCCKEKMYKYAKIFIKPLHDAQGQIVEWIAAGIDIHELLQTKEDLKITSARLQLALKTAKIGVFERELASEEITIDALDCSILGLDFEECKGKISRDQFMSIVHPDDKESLSTIIKKTSESLKGSTEAEFRVIWPDKSIHWISSTVEHHIHDGKYYIIGVHKDITQKKMLADQQLLLSQQAEEIKQSKQTELIERQRAEAAEEHKKRQEEFIDTICHEIRNPLSGVQGCISLLREEVISYFESNSDSPSKQKTYKLLMDYIDCIMECVHQQKVIVDDALDLSKLETSKLVLNPTAFNLKGLIQSVLQIHHATAVQKELWLRTEIREECLWIMADRERIKQALVNLVCNAVKFTDYGGVSIKVETETLSNNNDIKVHFTVEDTGIGVAPEDVPELYKKFSQIRRTDHNKPGSGLGLAITKHLVASMGGEVGYHHGKDGGSIFYFVLPCKTAQVSMDIEKENDGVFLEKATVPRTVLIVDDSKLNQKILASYLENDGHAYEVASNGQEAVDKCVQKHYDVIFMDVEMPIMNGYEATHHLRQKETLEHSDHPWYIVGLSGNARKEKVDEALKAGMDLYLTKPYHKADILRTVRSAPAYSLKRKRC